jgi:phosphoserine aminotransferase
MHACSIYITGLVIKWVEEQGGLVEFERRSAAKATLVYDAIAQSDGFYMCPVDGPVRSRVNVPFRICQQGEPDEALEAAFIKVAEARGMVALKGHR